MKRIKKFSRRFFAAARQIKLTDRCLILFMIILMAQSIRSLFFPETSTQGTAAIDVVIRTTAAAIFGYFISANFVRKPHIDNTVSNDTISPPYESEVTSRKIDSNAPKNQIGFTNQETTKSEETKRGYVHENDKIKQFRPNSQQIVIVTTIGLVSLIVIVIFRNNYSMTAVAQSTVSQLRDFISGSVGFLLGYVGTGK